MRPSDRFGGQVRACVPAVKVVSAALKQVRRFVLSSRFSLRQHFIGKKSHVASLSGSFGVSFLSFLGPYWVHLGSSECQSEYFLILKFQNKISDKYLLCILGFVLHDFGLNEPKHAQKICFGSFILKF